MFVIQKEQHGNKCLSVRDQIKSQTSHQRRKQQPTPVFLPRKFHGQRSLADYSPWGRKKSDMTEHAHHTKQYHHLLKAKVNLYVLTIKDVLIILLNVKKLFLDKTYFFNPKELYTSICICKQTYGIQ